MLSKQDVLDQTGGDKVKEAFARLNKMTDAELRAMVLIACNRVGTVMKGGDYEDVADAAIFLSLGISEVFAAYDEAAQSNTVYSNVH